MPDRIMSLTELNQKQDLAELEYRALIGDAARLRDEATVFSRMIRKAIPAKALMGVRQDVTSLLEQVQAVTQKLRRAQQAAAGNEPEQT
jgi:hypothetical protein